MGRPSSSAGRPRLGSGSGRSMAGPGRAGEQAEMAARPFQVLGIQQIALGSSDRHELRRLWVEALGLEPLTTFRSAAENVDEEILSVGLGLGAAEIDLMQPVDPSARPVIHTPAL